MEVAMSASSTEKVRSSSPMRQFLTSPTEKMKEKAVELLNMVVKIGRDDPRRILHSIKVGLALTLVSVFYYVNPLFNGFGTSAMWAVLTVVVVMEFTVGGTLGKGLNRTFATLLAGALGLGAHYVAVLGGERGEPILLGIFVFILAAAATFSRFVPEIKARYDYGVTITILTFSLVAVSSYRVEEMIQMAHQRLSTIALGVAACLVTSMFVFPVWAGEDLHKLTAANLDKLASFLEGLGAQFFEEKMGSGNLDGSSFLQVHKSVLNSKATEDSLANFARWEPGHGKFSFRHPWTQYLKIGAHSRQCAYSLEALAVYITTSDKNQASRDTELHQRIRSACAEMSRESGKALAELASAIRNMTSPPASASHHVANALVAAGKLKHAMPAGDLQDAVVPLHDVLRLATSASLLAQVVTSTHQIAASVNELAQAARFKKPEPTHKATIKPVADGESPPHVTIDIVL
ncbi:aluminum-activated malate transporter 1 [Iris pallida]|uniref:Aluminum-activated malate transporter 1 n=1 Tax=Iris pallida TaxID=29817 RepID=A0AAX6H048_IRIPA|nr:aluminum-activated malate transporter 1 [Iris pallida]